jgi:hypothetical protein
MKQQTKQMNRLNRRFWSMAGLACASALLLLMTVLWKDWIEIVFRVDPDQGSGRAEWLIVLLASAATVTFAICARIEWRQARSVAA